MTHPADTAADRRLLEMAAKAAGVRIKFAPDDEPDEPFATVFWLSSGPVISGCRFNRILFPSNLIEASICIEVAIQDPERKPHEH